MTSKLEEILRQAARGDGPEAIVLMRLLGEAATEAEARDALSAALDASAAEPVACTRLAALQRLWAAHPQAWPTVRAVLALAAHDRDHAGPDETLAYWATVFDRLAAASPEAGVALYSLGSADLLGMATQEIVAYLDRLGLLGPDRDVLDFGCGIGRVAAALAPRVRSLLGTDLSAGMIAEARRRHGHLGNVSFQHGDAELAPGSLDLVLAADVFPYLVQAGGGLAQARIRTFARLLRPGGAALILNFSYRGDRDADCRDVLTAAGAADLRLVKTGANELRLWDAATFLLTKPA